MSGLTLPANTHWRGTVDDVALVGRPIAVGCPRQERLDPRHLGAADGIELGDLDDPDAAHLLGRVLAADFGEFVGEPLRAGEYLQRTRLLRALRAFKDQHVVDFGAGLHDAGDGRDHPPRAERAIERRVLGAEVGVSPSAPAAARHPSAAS